MTKIKPIKYNNQKDYLNFIGQFPRAPFPIAGGFYCWTYLFHLNPTYKKYPELKKYLDFQPLDLIIYTNPSKKIFVGINWHALPLRVRDILLANLVRAYPNALNMERTRMPGLNYKKLLRYLKKIGIAVRKYRYERVRMLRFIPGDKLKESLDFYANFYYKSTYEAVANRYRAYKPG